MAVEFNIEGQNFRFPDWATESTMEEVSKVLQEIAKNNGVSDKDLKALVENNKKMHLAITNNAKDEKSSDKARQEEAKEAGGFLQEMIRGIKGNEDAIRDGNKVDKKEYKSFATKVIDDFENTGEQLVGAVGFVGGGVFKAGMLLGGAAVTGAGFISKAMMGAGSAINDLTSVGIGFNSTYTDMGKTTTQAIGQLGALGDGFAGAAQRMANSSSVIATQGFGRFTDTMKFAADTSEELGLSFQDSMDRFGQALDRRQAMLNLGNVDQGRLNQQVARTTRLQQAYSTAIGVSTAELQNFVSQLLDEGQLTATLLQFNDAVRSDVIGGIEVFASGMAAMGGKAGADLATAFQEAANTSAIGMSQAAIGMVTALPNLQGPMNEYITAVQNGTLSQDQAQGMVEGLTSTLGNLSHSEKQRIRAMANIGDESAKTMANAIAQFEQSESKMKDINKSLGTGFQMDLVQKGTNQFNKVMAQISGGAQNAFYSLFSDPEVTGAISDGFKEILDIFGFGVDDMSGAAMSMGDRVGKMATTLAKWIKVAADQLADFAQYIKTAFDKDGFAGVIQTLLGDIGSAITSGLLKLLAAAVPVIIALSTAKALAVQAVTGKVQAGVGGALADTIKNRVSSSGATAVGSGLEAAGSKATGMTESALSGGGKTGGFLQRIADGVKKFGDTKVLKGAAAIALLGASVGLAAVGLKQFNDVEWTSIVKGTIALGGLAALATVLGKASGSMLTGAAAIALLGLSILPLGKGLQLMKDVGLKTIGVLAAGLVVLGIAAAGLSFISPFIITGAIAIGALGLALIPLGLAMQLINEPLKNFGPSLSALADVDGGGLMNTAGGLLAVGAAMTLMAPMLPFMLIGSMAGPVMERLADSLYAFNRVDMKNLSMAGGAMKSLGGGMSAMSGGTLMSGIKDGIGALFGADSPIEKMKKFIDGLAGISVKPLLIIAKGFVLLQQAIIKLPVTLLNTMARMNEMSDMFLLLAEESRFIMIFGSNITKFAVNMKHVGDSFEKMGDDPFVIFDNLESQSKHMGMFATSTAQLNEALGNFDGAGIGQGFYIMGDGIAYLAQQIADINFADLLKIAALGLIGGSSSAGAKQVNTDMSNVPTSKAGQKALQKTSAPLVEKGITKTPTVIEDLLSEDDWGIASTSLKELTERLQTATAALEKGPDIDSMDYMDDEQRLKNDVMWAKMDIRSKKDQMAGGTGSFAETTTTGIGRPEALPIGETSDYDDEDIFDSVPIPTAIDRSPAGRAKRRREQLEKRKGGDLTGFNGNTGTDVDTAAQFPETKKQKDTKPKVDTTMDDFNSKPTSTTPTPNEDRIGELISLQTENNKLLKAQIKATKVLND